MLKPCHTPRNTKGKRPSDNTRVSNILAAQKGQLENEQYCCRFFEMDISFINIDGGFRDPLVHNEELKRFPDYDVTLRGQARSVQVRYKSGQVRCARGWVS